MTDTRPAGVLARAASAATQPFAVRVPARTIRFDDAIRGPADKPEAARALRDYRRSVRHAAKDLREPVGGAGIISSVVRRAASLSPAPGTLELLLAKANNHLEPNHLYVVQIDINNDGTNAAKLKGRTSIFETDEQGVPTCKGTFHTSSQPFRADAAAGHSPSEFKTRAEWDALVAYRYPYTIEGTYPMTTQRYGGLGGFGVNVTTNGDVVHDSAPAYRDENKSGAIEPRERKKLDEATYIRWHSAALGSAGCHTVKPSEWPRFAAIIDDYAKRRDNAEATYIFTRN
jgi:hypothetical protein